MLQLPPKLQWAALRHLMRARLIRRRVGFAIHRLHQALGEHIDFDFLPADIGQHVAIDFHARAQHLAALLDHLLPLHGIVDDVAVLERQIVFAHDGAHALAPAAGGFQVSNNFRFVHSVWLQNKLP